MASDKFGVIAFFGILVPGAYLAAVLILCVASGVELSGLQGHASLISFLSRETGLFAVVFVFVAYLLGVLVRLFAPDYVDRLSGWYLIQLRGSNEDWAGDKFPYERTVTSRLQLDGMDRITELMSRLNPDYGRPGNTPFFNYCKCFIDANDAALSRQVQDGEALVRFLSGTTLVLLIAMPLVFFLALTFAARGTAHVSTFYAGLLAMDLISLLLILERFKYQRRREVIMVWGSVYLILNGGSPTGVHGDLDELGASVFFARNAEESKSQTQMADISESAPLSHLR